MESSPPRAARIRALPLQLANQIAAGEVVERPASVVKELLENSLDAGAHRIEVEIEGGGARLIRVRDDGAGIHPEDLVLAVGRHATSKIARPEDLAAIASLGFRGEALASIAAVSRLRLSSAVGGTGGGVGEVGGWSLSVDVATGTVDSPQRVAHPPGTTVEVRDLFHNTPARRKFLRTDKTEFGHIDELVRRIALSHFDTALVLRHNRREVYRLAAALDEAGRERRLVRLCGRAFVEAARRIDFEAAGLRLWGWVGGAQYSRAQADLQYFYVNGRIIRDRVIMHALRQAYQAGLYPGRHPAYVLHLTVEAGGVDVNVHPTKHEVRFREARRVHDFLVCSVGDALQRDLDTAPGVEVSAGRLERSAYEGAPETVAEAQAAYASLRAGGSDAPAASARHVPPASWAGPLGRPVAVLHDAYLLTQGASGAMLVDVAAAQRFLADNALRAGLAEGSPRTQPLLLPCRLEVAPVDADRVERVRPLLAELGLEVDRLGPDALLLRRLPAVLARNANSVSSGQPRGAEVILRAVIAALQALDTSDEVEAVRASLLHVLAEQARSPAGALDLDGREALVRALEAAAPGGGALTARDGAGRVLWTPLSAKWLAGLFEST